MVSCERTINLKLTNDQPSGYLDIGQALCKLNRKGAFRQGMQYVIESIRINTYTSGATEIQIGRIPDNWITTNAWVKALAEWNNQQLGELRESGTESMKSKWRDFKVYMNGAHADEGTDLNLLPDGYGLTEVGPGDIEYDWDYSKVVMPNTKADGEPEVGVTQEYFLHMLGGDNESGADSKSVIHAYALSRSRPNAPDPNIVEGTTTGQEYGGLWQEIVDVGMISDEIIENVSERNNEPPYPLSVNNSVENYPGGMYVGEGTSTTSYKNTKGHTEAIAEIGEGVRSIIPGFVAPLGLLYIGAAGGSGIGSSESIMVQVKIAPGNYHGVLAQSMKVAN